MSTAAELCDHWLLHYECYRVWQQFQRDSRVRYSCQRWNMREVSEVIIDHTLTVRATAIASKLVINDGSSTVRRVICTTYYVYCNIHQNDLFVTWFNSFHFKTVNDFFQLITIVDDAKGNKATATATTLYTCIS